ncbi:glucose-specific phosphotransferase system IIA component [Lactobacillus colini]|uniref:Glucose-specific phosphotransferase system IIA component n=1 Tax=Lactobacillus colini TaxID=1819254 RepID=A0ABS4MEU4_9LACO|nr:glucose PTS transporter subunit IIA [Lactobacillus colini]MBP2058212.1 glucose-specific phosphotransferase system IIA component [Lactobacillus colini]
MAVDYQKLAERIVTNVGGEENINSLTHCMTRLRFDLKDVKKANKDALENIDEVLGVVYAGGQYMVVLGQNLVPTFDVINKNYSVKTGEVVDENLDAPKKEPWTWKNAGQKIIGFVSASVTPLIPGLVAGGMLKVFLLLWSTFIDKGFTATSSYQLLAAIADAPFYFMPIFVAYGAAKKLGGTPIYAMVASAALLHGNYTALVTAGKTVSLFTLPVRLVSYSTSLLPALLIAIVAYYAEKYLNKIVPGIFKSVLVGSGTIFIAGALGFLILGPIGNIVGQWIADAFMFLNRTVGPLAVGLLAAALPWMVMSGMHTALAPFMTQLLTNPGYDALLRPAFILHNMSEGGANIGVALRTKNAKFRSECWSLAVGCIVAGVTEPALYGVNLKLKRPMWGVMAGGLTGGIVAGLLGARAYVMGYSNLIALPIFSKTIMAMVIAIIVAIIVSIVVTYILGIEEKDSKKNKITPPVQKIYPDDAIIAVSEAELMPLEQVKDEVFSTKAMGDGVAFKLNSDFVCAPANGTISALFPTGHSFGLTTNNGLEFLVHIGIDTVKLNGKGFDVLVNQGDKVRAGQPIIRIDRKAIEKEGYDLTTMLIITNDSDNKIKLKTQGTVDVGSKLN